jgi:hypothetical protein
VSRAAIAAALAMDCLGSGERLVAFSLASFANREHRAWPGTAAAAARAGLGKSRYLEARDLLIDQGLVRLDDDRGAHGRARTLMLTFATSRSGWDGSVNPGLFEAALSYSRARGPARLLLAVLAAVAGEDRVVEGLTTEEVCRAAGLGDRSYRRARQALLASGELVVVAGAGGRGITNRWEIADPRRAAGQRAAPRPGGRRLAPPRGARPLIATVPSPADTSRTALPIGPATLTATTGSLTPPDTGVGGRKSVSAETC